MPAALGGADFDTLPVHARAALAGRFFCLLLSRGALLSAAEKEKKRPHTLDAWMLNGYTD